MYCDSHLHTCFSSDSDTPVTHQIHRAMELGMTEITFTDHYDMDFPEGELDFIFDVPAYFETMKKLQAEYADRIRINIGVELGLQPRIGDKLEDFVSRYPFEFIIGSTHLSRGLDPYESEKFMAGLTEEEAYRIYFEEELYNLKLYDCYDVAGHIDYVVRYGPNRNRNYTWDRYSDVLDEILRTVIARGKGIELNTGGYRAGLGCGNPAPRGLERYRELGGEIITLGSDAHTPDRMGDHFEDAAALLRSLGFRYYCVFRNREPVFLPL